VHAHGEKAHSRYFSEGAFAKLKDDNKELLIIPYDKMESLENPYICFEETGRQIEEGENHCHPADSLS